MILEPQPIAETGRLDREVFEHDVVAAGRPVVLRGLVAKWPAEAMHLGFANHSHFTGAPARSGASSA